MLDFASFQIDTEEPPSVKLRVNIFHPSDGFSFGCNQKCIQYKVCQLVFTRRKNFVLKTYISWKIKLDCKNSWHFSHFVDRIGVGDKREPVKNKGFVGWRGICNWRNIIFLFKKIELEWSVKRRGKEIGKLIFLIDQFIRLKTKAQEY